jgi:hypothetical protein
MALKRLKRFERSEAVEPFDRTQGRLLEHLERADHRDEWSIAVERLERFESAFSFCESVAFNAARWKFTLNS